MRRLAWAIIALGVFLIVASAGIGFVLSGPSATVPAGNLIEQLNSAHADLADNAAPIYKQAHAAMRTRMPPALQIDQVASDDEMRRLAREWVDANRDALALAIPATALPNYWSDLPADSALDPRPELSRNRELAKLIAVSGWLAIADGDAATAGKSAVAVDAMGRHFAMMPTLIDQLVAIALRALAQDLVIAAAERVNFDAPALEAFIAEVEPCFVPSSTLGSAARTDADLMVQALTATGTGTTGGFWMLLVAPPSRVAGELQRVTAPMVALLAQPPETWTDPTDPTRIELQSQINAPRSQLNVAGTIASIVIPTYSELVPIAARFVATQRGNWTALQVLLFERKHGAPPRLLAELPPSERIIDPFSGRPFVYHTEIEGAFKLYSLALDRDDDGGMHDARWGRDQGVSRTPVPPDGDYVFWPPAD